MKALLLAHICIALATALAWVTHPCQALPLCVLTIDGPRELGRRSSQFTCTGGSIVADIHQELLKVVSVKGVVLKRNCASTSRACLITICGQSSAVVHANVSGLQRVGHDTESILCLRGRSKITFRTPIFRANYGTGIHTSERSTAIIQGGLFLNNTAPGGAGVFAAGISTVLIDNATFVNNTVDGWYSGGAISTDDEASVFINNTLLKWNNALLVNSGGAITLHGNSTVRLEDSTLTENTAEGAGGAVAAYDQSHLVLSRGSKVGLNVGSLNGCGAGILLTGESTMFAENASFVSNRNDGGNGGNLCLQEKSSAVIYGCMLSHGWASFGGGGVFMEGAASASIYGSIFLNNSVRALENASFVVEESKVLNGTSDLTYSSCGLEVYDSSRAIVKTTAVSGIISPKGGQGCALVASDSSVLVLQDVTVRNNHATIGGGLYARGDSNVSILGKTIFEGNQASSGSDMYIGSIVNLTVSPDSNIDVYNGSSVYWIRSVCISGEMMDVNGYCQKCQPSTYSFDPTGANPCQGCPEHAMCPGGDAINPLPSYWHSSRYSSQIHRCPHVDQVCGYNATCAAGYAGNLCGVCETGYGSDGSFACGKCMSVGAQWAAYVCAVVVAVLLVAYTVHATWQDNQDGDQTVRPSDMLKLVILFLQYLVIIGSLAVPWPESLPSFFKFPKFIFGAFSGQIVSLDCLLSGLSQGINAPVAVQGQLFFLIAPLGLLAAVFLLSVVKHVVVYLVAKCKGCSRSVRSSWHDASLLLFAKLPVMCIVVLFFSYPSLVRVSLGFFACLSLDLADAASDPYPQYAIANASQGYWVPAMQQGCWEGWHRSWAAGLGIPSTLFFCLAVPCALIGSMVWNKKRLNERSFRSRFGFLYRNFRESRCWWEGVLAVQTMLLVSVAVFRYTLGGYFSMLLVNVMFGTSAALQLLFKPYASPKLHRLQLSATGCLFVTSYFALSLFTVDVDSPSMYKEVIGVGVLLVNVCFLGWCCFLILRESQPIVARWAAAVRLWLWKRDPKALSRFAPSSISGQVLQGQLCDGDQDHEAAYAEAVANGLILDGDEDDSLSNKVIANPPIDVSSMAHV